MVDGRCSSQALIVTLLICYFHLETSSSTQVLWCIQYDIKGWIIVTDKVSVKALKLSFGYEGLQMRE